MSKSDTFLPFALPSIGKEEINAVVNVMKTGWLTTGIKTKEFEEAFKLYTGAKYAIAVNSCTAALHLSLLAIELKADDEVILPTMTFTATAEVITYFNAKPVFIDCDPDTLLMDPEKIEEKITKKTKAIMGVHYAGQPCDINKILKIAKKHNLKVIWDAAHALPTTYKNKSIAKFSDLTCFSFYVTKTITTGEGGMITTNNKTYAEKIRIASLHGMSRDAWKRYQKGGSWFYEIVMPGFKYNLTDIASSIGLEQLKKCSDFKNEREKIATDYNKAFDNIDEIKTLKIMPYGTTAWHLYPIQISLEKLTLSRNEFIDELTKKGIGSSVHFIPLHMQPYWKKTYKLQDSDCPVASHVYDRMLSLPIYQGMKQSSIKAVIKSVIEIINNNRK